MIGSKASGTYSFYERDHLSIRGVLSDSNPGSPSEQGHLPFGEIWYGSGIKWRFTSYERDSDVGDDFATFRRYQYTFGRFNSPDPVMGIAENPQRWNRYTYVDNDPLNFVDSLGLLLGYCTANGVQWDSADSADESDGAASCADAGGSWTDTVDTQSVTVDGGSADGVVYEWDPFTQDYIPTGNVNDNVGSSAGDGKTGQPYEQLGYKSLRACADDIANHWSVAGLLPGSPGLKKGFVGGLWSGIAGNSVAGISDLYDQIRGQSENTPGNLFGGQLTGNVSQGIPLPGGDKVPAGAKGPVGALLDASGETGAYVAKIVGPGKIVFDVGAYVASATFCFTGKY